MRNRAKKKRPPETAGRRTALAEDPAARRRRPAEPPAMPGIPNAELTPTVRSAVGELMAELDRLKDELTAARQRVSQLEEMADEDPLVPVLNRRGFGRELERTIAYLGRYGTTVSLVYLDLDDFKAVNDAHGHAAGDAALVHLCEILTANVRRSDLVGRLGGDEFAIILHHADRDAAEMKAGQLGDALARSPLVHGGATVPLSLTAGVTELREDDIVEHAIARADRDMYAGKAARRRHEEAG